MKKGKHQKKKNISTANTSQKKEVKINPFEFKFNRKKNHVLGQTLKHDRGQPGVSRNKMNKKRLELYKKKELVTKKSNRFVDKRLGEYDESTTNDDLVVARLIQARSKKFKKNLFNLNEDEKLTHLGMPLSEIEAKDKPFSDSEEDDDAQLNANVVNKAHFGGFSNKKEENKTYKEIMEDIIVENKKKKMEKQTEKKENDDLTDKLDEEWKEMNSIVTSLRRTNDEDKNAKVDTYDMTFQQLKFEPRASASKALQNEEYKRKAEEKRLMKLEEERKLRMIPSAADKMKNQTSYEMTADSLDDNLDIDGSLQVPEILPVADDMVLPFKDLDADSALLDDNEFDSDVNGNTDSDIDSDVNEDTDCDPLSTIPQSIEELLVIIKDKSGSEASLLITSIIENNNPTLREGNKSRLQKFFILLVQYLCRTKKDFSQLQHFNDLVPHLYSLAQLSPTKTGIDFQSLLIKKISFNPKKKRNKRFPSFDVIVILKLVSILYPTSDFRHPIVTPALVYMSDLLSSSYSVTFHNVVSRLFLSNLFLEYVCYSKRLAPEPVNFLLDIVYLSCETSTAIDYSPVHKVMQKSKEFLLIDQITQDDPQPINLNVFSQFDAIDNVNNLKVSIVNCAVKQLIQFANLYDNAPVFEDLFIAFVSLSDNLPTEKYPKALVATIQELKSLIVEKCKPKKCLTFPNRKPPMLKMLEPRYDTNSKHSKETIAGKMKMQKELSHKIKKEQRGVIREMRRDAQFIAREKLKERIAADTERKMKVNKLCHELAEQEGEFKKMIKKRKL